MSLPITAMDSLGGDGYYCPNKPHAFNIEHRIGGELVYDFVWCDGLGAVTPIVEGLRMPVGGHCCKVEVPA